LIAVLHHFAEMHDTHATFQTPSLQTE